MRRTTPTSGLLFVCLPLLTMASAGPTASGKELTKQEIEEGFVSIFDGKTLTGWEGNTEGYEAENGVLICTKTGGRMRTQQQYTNFTLRFDYRLQPGGNNGIDVRGMEIQILDDDAPKHAHLKPCQYHGSIYCHVPAKRGHQKPIGQWNSQEITVDGKHVKVTLNETIIVDAETDHTALDKRQGPIGFKGHHEHVEFRNLRLKKLP